MMLHNLRLQPQARKPIVGARHAAPVGDERAGTPLPLIPLSKGGNRGLCFFKGWNRAGKGAGPYD